MGIDGFRSTLQAAMAQVGSGQTLGRSLVGLPKSAPNLIMPLHFEALLRGGPFTFPPHDSDRVVGRFLLLIGPP
jgi:hypothetical protein